MFYWLLFNVTVEKREGWGNDCWLSLEKFWELGRDGRFTFFVAFTICILFFSNLQKRSLITCRERSPRQTIRRPLWFTVLQLDNNPLPHPHWVGNTYPPPWDALNGFVFSNRIGTFTWCTMYTGPSKHYYRYRVNKCTGAPTYTITHKNKNVNVR